MPSVPATSRPAAAATRRRLLLASVALNVALVAAIAVAWIGEVPAARVDVARVVKRKREVVQTASRSQTPSGAVTNQIPSRWSELESSDYRVYLANLRQAGCPEATVRHILLADLEDLYERRGIVAGVPTNFWAPEGGLRFTPTVQKNRQALAGELRAVVRELLGIEYWGKKDDDLIQEALLAFLCGHIDPERREALAGLFRLHKERIDGMREAVGNLMRPADVRQVWQLYGDWKKTVEARYNSAETEEAWLRVRSFVLAVDGDEQFAGMTLSAAEMRELMKAVFGNEDEVRRTAAESFNMPELRPAEPAADQRDRLGAAVQAVLGPEQIADWERAKNDDFQKLFRLARSADLGPEVAVRAWEVREQARVAMESVRQDPALDEAGRLAGLRRQAGWARDQLEGILGKEGLKAYQQQDGGWFLQWLP